MTTVKTCSCPSTFQDKEYGSKQRLMNLNDKGGAVCTVCGALHRASDETKKK